MSISLKVARARPPMRSMPGIGYSQGDPGLFGFLGKVGRTLGGIASNIPGPIGFAARGARKIFGNKPGPGQPPVLPGMQRPPGFPAPMMTNMPVLPAPGVRGAVQRFLPGGNTGLMVPSPPAGEVGLKGYRLNKSDYFLKDGTFVPAGTRWVRIRRRNALNPRALDRAMGRITSAKNAAVKLGRITIRKKC